MATVIIMLAVAFGIALLVALVGGYFFSWDWTGFSPYTPPIKDGNFQRGKTLWDWLNLLGVLAIPVVVGLGAAWYTAQQGKVSDRENTDNQREAALQAYIDKISELILHERLGNPTLSPEPPTPEVLVIAQARTATVLRILDPTRRGSLVQFLSKAAILNICVQHRLVGIDLQEADLFQLNLSTVNLSGANLRRAILYQANLHKAHLVQTNLSEATLFEANASEAELCYADFHTAHLNGADMSRTDLAYANLSGATLFYANLSSAKLYQANLSKARLGMASLEGANLKGANLHMADLSKANLSSVTGITAEELEKQARSLKGAIMPDGSIHP